MGGLWLQSPWGRVVVLAIPIAMALNGLRVFLTGFLAYFVDPAWSEGFMHYTEGWVIFVVAFVALGAVTWALVAFEGHRRRAER